MAVPFPRVSCFSSFSNFFFLLLLLSLFLSLLFALFLFPLRPFFPVFCSHVFCVHSLWSRDGSRVLGLLLPWPSPSLVFHVFLLFPTFSFCFSCYPSFDPYCSHSSSSLFALYIFPVFCSHVFAFVFSFLHSVPLSFFCDLARFALLHSSSRRLQSSLCAHLCEPANTFASV